MSSAFDSRPTEISPRALSALVVASIVSVAVADWLTPLGYVEWMFYVGPVALAAVGRSAGLPVATAFVCALLLVLGFGLTDDAVVAREVSVVNRAIGVAVVSVMGFVGTAFVRSRVQVEREGWLRTGESRLQALLEGNPSLEQVGQRALGFLTDYAMAPVGALHSTADGQRLRRVALHGGSADPEPVEVRWGETLVGQCAAENAIRRVKDMPTTYLTVRSGLGAAAPLELLLVPLQAGEAVVGVLELGFFRALGELDLQLLVRVQPLLGVAMRSADYRARVERLLEETQRQAEELQSQQEELRVTNEELETQAQALRASQQQLEEQQVELERSNAELEEQAAELEERQHALVQARVEVEQANRHKSQFLANMSHELRTPLNSTLILARLLADNAPGTLTAEQVKFAETIYAAGNDLLTLISDILDLSKIEAGRMDLAPEPTRPSALLEQVERICRPLAQNKKLSFEIQLDPDAPAEIVTDRQRVQQILRNLLSNALKFTEQGGVSIRVGRTPQGLAFHVRDTGPGIAAEHQELVFEPFKQVDPSVSRAHGGTGLGLSISRNLARLLGGELTLSSALGQGSTFTLALPLAAPSSPQAVPTSQAHSPHVPIAHGPRAAITPAPEPSEPHSTYVPDDRDEVKPGSRCLLVIEDDPKFAMIVRDLAREIGLPSLVVRDAREGIQLARRYRPIGVVLDINLPDESGLTVLERLKRDPATRHIPIHVVSAMDHSETALRLGAVGYAIKPLAPDQLVGAIRRLERTSGEGQRSVLVVEDDAVQRESVCKLISNEQVHTEAVGTVRGALELLSQRTFDCMIVDLRLSDGSGFELLDELAAGDRYSFPPVIVYTGQSLSAEEERRLRSYSQSVIVKGARSPERLLDEVALFLHQVEQSLPPEHQKMLRTARARDAALEDRRILVVEDDVRNIFALTSLFEPRGAIVEVARNGQEALERLDRQPPVDLVLMDVMMPVMDGLEATRRIRQRPELQKLPVLMLTAKAMQDDQERCLAAGANDYASKPLDVDKLLSLVRVWMPHGRR